MTFDDVRIEDHETYFFHSSWMTHELKHWLEHNNITGYRLLCFEDIPKNISIPPVRLNEEDPDLDDRPSLLISNMNIEDLTRKLNMIQNGSDSEVKEYNKKKEQDAIEDMKYIHPEIYKRFHQQK